MFENKTVLTGIKPTGTPHLGNLVGAIQPVIEMSQQAARSYIFIADLHALNAVRDRALIKKWSTEVAATFLALGLDTDKAAFFRQSDIPEIYQLTTFLMNVTPKGLLNRAHSYKAAVDRNQAKGNDPDAGINMGLFSYPVLMAADILLYQSEMIPVGMDQKQHVEFARDIAQSFNHIYEREVLTIPEPIIQDTAKAVPGLDSRKMSKSYNNYIPIFEESNRMKNLIMKIVTDSRLPEAPKDPENSVIFQLYQNFAAPDQIEALRQRFIQGGLGYKDAKMTLFEAIESTLKDAREQYKTLLKHPKKIDDVLLAGAEKARYAARKTIQKVSKAMLGRVTG